MNIKIPDYVNTVLQNLHVFGFEAFIVGGCVRDVLMDKVPADWDVCTSAKPEEIKRAFSSYKTIDTGIRHGTVAVLTKGQLVEVTTFRIDGEYLDGRHPEKVEFTGNIMEDLARRDFTMNAIAFDPVQGLIDPYDGSGDIERRVIRAVGEPVKRFKEDALRIVRGLRFASVLGFEIESETKKAMDTCCSLVGSVSAERIQTETSKLLMGDGAGFVLGRYFPLIKNILPCASAENLSAIDCAEKDLPLRLALLFSEETSKALEQLKFSNEIRRKSAQAAALADFPLKAEIVTMRKLVCEYGMDTAVRAVLMQQAKGVDVGKAMELLRRIREENQCCCRSQLAVNGKDLISLGKKPGAEIGKILDWLLEQVIEGRLENEKEKLLEAAMSYCA